MKQFARRAQDIIIKAAREGGDAAGSAGKNVGRKLDADTAGIRGQVDKMTDFTPYRLTDRRRRRDEASGNSVTQDALDREFARQRREQLEALGRLDAMTWLRRQADGRQRPSDSLDAQRAERLNATSRRDAMANGLNPEMLAATHRLDGTAGGDWNDISGLGDSSINSSLGSQWGSRKRELMAAIETLQQNNPNLDLSTVPMSMFLPTL